MRFCHSARAAERRSLYVCRSTRWRSWLKWLWNAACTETNFCSDFIRRNRCIARSRRRNGGCEFSDRLLSRRPISRRSKSRVGALQRDRIQSVRDDRFSTAMAFQCVLQEQQSRGFGTFSCNLALQDLALVIHGAPQVMLFTNTSSSCQRHSRKPCIQLTRWRRTSAANSGPKPGHHNRTISWQMSLPRSNSRSSTFRKLNGDRTYIITTKRMISGEEVE